MHRQSHQNESGQAVIEYSLLLGAILVMFIGLSSLAPLFTGRFNTLAQALKPVAAVSNHETPVEKIANDFLKRIQAFYDKNGRYPRTWGDYRFTDLGLNPQDWKGLVEGISWNPHGNEIGLANKPGDNIQVYVKDLKGNLLHLYDGWNIWCRGGKYYFHTVAPGNEVDIRTLVLK